MNTTQAFVEIIVSGVLALAAVLLLAMGVFGITEIEDLLSAPQYIAGALLAVSAYAFGVAFDRVWDICSHKLDRGIRYQYFATDTDVERVRTKIFADSERLSAFLDYIRTRMRIARNCMFTFPLLGLGAASALFRMSFTATIWDELVVVLFCLGLGILFRVAFKKLLHSYYKQLHLAGEHSLGLTLAEPATPPPK